MKKLIDNYRFFIGLKTWLLFLAVCAAILLSPVLLPALVIYLVAKQVQRHDARRDAAIQQQYEYDYQQWAAQQLQDQQTDSVLQWIKLDDNTELAIVGYVREPDLKAIVKVVTQQGFSDKSWKRSVRTKKSFSKSFKEDVCNYIMLNGKEYRVAI